MTEQTFSLVPFPTTNLPAITIVGTISCQNGVLALHYSLAGNIGEVRLPSPSAHPARKDALWKTTCFEFFLAIEDQPQYWEFNLSPSGDWNVYRMDAYRRIGFREETSIQRLPFDFREEQSGYSLRVSVNISPILPRDQSILTGIAAIIQAKDGDMTYWALLHPAAQADFHLKESFLCSL